MTITGKRKNCEKINLATMRRLRDLKFRIVKESGRNYAIIRQHATMPDEGYWVELENSF